MHQLFLSIPVPNLSNFYTKDILEKIRECGSSVTYYGGRVLNNQSPEVSPMTKAIMREIHHSDNNICEVCHPNGAVAATAAAVAAKKLYTTFCDADKNHLGKMRNKSSTNTHKHFSFQLISFHSFSWYNTFYSNEMAMVVSVQCARKKCKF